MVLFIRPCYGLATTRSSDPGWKENKDSDNVTKAKDAGNACAANLEAILLVVVIVNAETYSVIG